MFWTSHNDIEKTNKRLDFEIGKIDKQDWYRFAVEEKSTHKLIGTALIYYEEEVEAWKIGYNFGKCYWGHGYATEAMRCVIDFAQTRLGVVEVVGRYAKDNPTSGRDMKSWAFNMKRIYYFLAMTVL